MLYLEWRSSLVLPVRIVALLERRVPVVPLAQVIRLEVELGVDIGRVNIGVGRGRIAAPIRRRRSAVVAGVRRLRKSARVRLVRERLPRCLVAEAPVLQHRARHAFLDGGGPVDPVGPAGHQTEESGKEERRRQEAQTRASRVAPHRQLSHCATLAVSLRRNMGRRLPAHAIPAPRTHTHTHTRTYTLTLTVGSA